MELYSKLWYLKETICKPYYKLVNFIANVQDLVYWIPIIWKSHDWEAGFAIEFFKLKMIRIMESIDSTRFHVGDEKKVKRMKTFILLLDRLFREDYCPWSYLEDADTIMSAKPYFFESIPFSDVCKKSWEHERMLRKQDIDLVCLYWKKYEEGWWN